MMKLFLILAIPFMVVTVKPWKMKMKEYPYADMNLEQKVAHDGYPLEQYQVITKDHYYLTIFRIPYGRNLTDSINRSPVLLVHGMGASIDMFLLLGPGKGLAYALADSGYDVWLLNARGLWKSQRHKFYNINKHRRYWKFSIPYGRNLTDSINRSPALLVHGLGASIDIFLLLGPGKGLAYALADSGYDVWLLNARGLWKSQRYKFYNINKRRRYWKFSFHEIAIYDLATNIDFILEKTKQKPFLIGHSQGNTCIFVLLAMKPDYNDKIKMGVAYAPTIKIVVDNIVAKVFVYGEEMVEGLYALLGADELTIMPNIMSIFSTICKEQLYFLTLCYHVLQVIGSHQSQLIDKDLVPAIVSSVPRNAAMQFLHYMQIAKRGTFAQYDYGAKRNMQRYNSTTPPLYDLNKITACIAIFYGEKDDIITVKGSLETIDMLSNVCYIHKVEYPYFNHIDFIFAKNASELVYKPTVDIFRKYDAEHN